MREAPRRRVRGVGGAALVVAAAILVAACGTDATSSPSGAPSTSSPAATTATGAPAPSSPEAPATSPESPSATGTQAPAGTPAQPGGIPPGVALPNPSLTPGEAFPGATVAEICRSGYASSVRHVELAQYHEVYAAYHIPYPQPSGTYELDHLIPLELGGDNANANLWPESASPTPGFHQKDELENALHELVCSGQVGLPDAQRAIATNWYAAYVRYVVG